MLQRQAFDAQKRWYDEYCALLERVLPIVTENDALRRRLQKQEERLLAVELTPEHLGDVGSEDLARLAHHYQALLTEIVAELRARHCDIAEEELVAPRVRAVERELADARERLWATRQELRELEHENQRLSGALATTPAAGDAAAG